MGQPLPLPERIPRPNNTELEKLKSMGIIPYMDEPVNYVTYTLPEGWRTVDKSPRRDIVVFEIVDSQNQIRVRIVGGWNETYDNDIKLLICSEPYSIHQDLDRNETIGGCETSAAALFGHAMTGQPSHRVKRCRDFS